MTNPLRHLRGLLATWRGRLILGFLVVQLLLPLHYYLIRRDRHDERYAWRMFSPMRMARCSVQIAVDGRPLQLGGKFHEAWIETAERGRLVVVEAMAAKLCAENPGARVEVTLDCRYLDRTPQRYGGHDLCSVPSL